MQTDNNLTAQGDSFARLVNRKQSAQEPAKILLVDDKGPLLASLHHLLKLYGYEADQALGGEAAMRALAAQQYDLVLLDLMMPGISGHDILDYAAREALTCKIIVVSGDASFSGVKHALHCGAFDFVKKPYEAAELIGTMETALRQIRLEQERDELELQVKESESLHRFIVNSSPDLVFMLDREGRFSFVNDRIESMLGFDKKALLGQHVTALIEESDWDAASQLFGERRTGTRVSKNVELRLKSKLQDRRAGSDRTQTVWAEFTAMGVYAGDGEPSSVNFSGTYATARDVSERKRAQALINFQAHHDLLTHLPNRILLKERLDGALIESQRKGTNLAAMFIDLDRFKVVNDTLGHSMGDRLLQAVANRLQSCLRSGDTLSRFGGDEFALLLPQVRSREDVVVIAEKILDRLKESFVIEGHELFVGASIGISMYPETGGDEETLIQNADIAMYHVKARGKNGYQFFSEEMNQQFSSRLKLEREIRNALAEKEFEVFYQPQVSMDTGTISGVEALVRWRHQSRGLIDPGEFLPLAQETGLLVQIDEFVQRQAFQDVAGWHRAGLGPIDVAVNLTSSQIEQDSFIDHFKTSLRSSGLAPTSVKMEITESTLMQDVELIVPKLRLIRSLGARIAIDDFGTGYSSLSYLHQFPINSLKIDCAFVRDIRAEDQDASIVDAIVAMAKGLRLDLVAEGVENRTQLKYLKARGCEEVQGYIFSPPVPAGDLAILLKENSFAQILSKDSSVIPA